MRWMTWELTEDLEWASEAVELDAGEDLELIELELDRLLDGLCRREGC